MSRQKVLALMALFIAILSWSSVPLFLKHFTAYLDGWTVNGFRYGIAALLMAPAFWPQRNGGPFPAKLWREALVPALVNAAGQVGWALIPYFVSASVMGFGIRTSFLFLLLGSVWLLPEERYYLRSALFWSGSAACVAGAVCLFEGSLRSADASVPGLLMLLGTSAIWGFYPITVRKFMRNCRPAQGFAVVGLYGALLIFGLMMLYGHPAALWKLDGGMLALLILSAALGISIAHVMMFYVLNHLGPVIEGGAEMLTPFLTFCGAALIFGEQLSPLQWVGGLALVMGCVLMISAHKK